MKKLNLETAMSKSVLSVRWSHPVRAAHEVMEERRVRHLPVVGDDGTLVGIISDRDVLRAMDPKHATFSADARVGDFMNWPVLTVEKTTPLADAVNTLIQEKISCLVITSGPAVVGIVTTEDLLRVLRDLLAERKDVAKMELGDIKYSPIFTEAVREIGSMGI